MSNSNSNSNPQKARANLRTLGGHKLLLTEAESRCFYVARDYQRKSLLRALAPMELLQWQTGFQKLGWSKNPLILAVQSLVLAVALLPMCVWLLVKCCLRWIAFPFRYWRTFIVPKDLKAPGEKTLAGIHNAFGGHLNLSAGDYIACINDWISILYGEESLLHHNLENLVSREMDKDQNQIRDFSTAMRSLVAVSREKLSKELGHYGRVQRLH